MPPEAPAAPLSIEAGIDAIPADPAYQLSPTSQPAPTQQQPAAKATSAPEGDSGGGETTETPAPKEAPKTEAPKADVDLSEGLSKLRKQPKAAEQPAANPEADKTAQATEPKGPKELRNAYELTKKENASLQAKINELAKAKEEGTKAEIAKAQAELTAKLEQLQKKYDDNETRLRFVDYTRSDEHIEKYEKPLENAWNSAGKLLKGYTVQLPDGTTRTLQGSDIVELVSMEPGAAHEKAEQMFGAAKGGFVMRQIEKIRDLKEAKDTAIEEWKQKGSEYQAEQQRIKEETQKFAIQHFESRQEQLRKDAPDLFDFNAEEPLGKEAKEYVESRERLNALAFRGMGLKEGVTPEERIKLVTKAQAEVAAASRILPYHILRANKAEERVAELEKKLAEFKNTEPSPGGKAKGGGGGGKTEPKSIVEGIDMIPSSQRV